MNKMCTMLERLAEMFPKQSYQSKLETYLLSKGIKTQTDIEHWSRNFERHQSRGIFQ